MPEHDANLIVFRSVIQQIGQHDVHGRRHCVFSLWPIQLNPQDVSGTLSNNVTHNIDLLCCDAGEVGLAIKSPGSNRRALCAENLGHTGMNPSSASSVAPSSKSIR